MKKILLNPRFLLPLIVTLGVLIMGMRVADMWNVVASGKLSLHPAVAEEATAPRLDTQAAAISPSPDPAPDVTPPRAAADTTSEPAMTAPPPDADASPAELDVLKQLSDRREQLEKRSRDLDTRESLLKVTETRVDNKIKEMETLRLQLQSMVSQASEAQQAQLDNLVKIYETMKPEEAARVFETLDMPVLLSVIQRMKPKSTAPIMAKMAPEKAKEVTVALTKQDQLPQLK
jgi:flagellar motility protein MotE (MotC chaperone)